MKGMITAASRIDAKTFRRFAYFDTFSLKKRYRKPLGFAAIMLAFSLCCFFLLGDRPQARLLGGVLLGVGIALPLAYFASFALSVRAQVKAMKLGEGREAYRLTMTDQPEGLEIVSADGKERVKLKWKQVYGAYRVKGCVYLYAHPTRAFLLPDGQASAPADEVFAFLVNQIGKNRTQDCRGRQSAR